VSRRGAIGLSHFLLRGGQEITEIVAEMHEAIAWHRPLPYRIVSGSFAALAKLASAIPADDSAAVASAGWRRFEAVVNGVYGDSLASWRNPLAITLGARDRDGTPIDLDAIAAEAPRGVVLFVHGLCGGETDWASEPHAELVRELRDAGFGAAWLRYNSGLAVDANGAALADWLEAAFASAPAPSTLILIGHSMGGLVMRSACAHAERRGHAWLARLTHAAYLGTPHHGAPLERAGEFATTLLAATPYSAALARAGRARSRGIQDLRHACVEAPLPAHVRHLLVAGCTVPDILASLGGDGMVPLPSALGEHADPDRCLTAPLLERIRIAPLGHLALLDDARVYTALREWLPLPRTE
jgi:hypothetical protein